MRLRFSDCVFDSDTREILRDGKPVHVSPKAFALLSALIQKRPNAISKDDLHGLLWPDTFVSDANLPNLVAELRESLGDDAQKPRIIRTVPRFGYAFRAEAAGEIGVRPDAPAFRLIWGDREIALHPGENVIGRDEAAALWIDDTLVWSDVAPLSDGGLLILGGVYARWVALALVSLLVAYQATNALWFSIACQLTPRAPLDACSGGRSSTKPPAAAA